MENTENGYRLSSGREFSANGLHRAGLVSIGRKADGSFLIGAGYDGTLPGATGDDYEAPDPGERDPNWTPDERRELADFMIALWTAFKKASRCPSSPTPRLRPRASATPPDFDQIARTFLDRIDEAFTRADADALLRATAEQLRLVWNARGAEIEALHARVAELEALLDEVPPGT